MYGHLDAKPGEKIIGADPDSIQSRSPMIWPRSTMRYANSMSFARIPSPCRDAAALMDRKITAEEAVKAYHGALQKLGIPPFVSLLTP